MPFRGTLATENAALSAFAVGAGRHSVKTAMVKSVGVFVALAGLFLVVLAVGCQSKPAATDEDEQDEQVESVAVTSSYLEAVVRDLLNETVAIVPLAGPGMCPGHFDIQPSRIERLATCRLLVRFDFQEALAAKLAGRVGPSLKIASVTVPGGLCDPTAYSAACRDVAVALVEGGWFDQAQADERLAAISQRMRDLNDSMRAEIDAAGLGGSAVVASRHQEAFCRLLGLNVVGTFAGADTTQASELGRTVAAAEQSDARWIIANLPEGRRMADALADRLGATVIVFGNFPEPDEPQAFDVLVRTNVENLIEATRP